MRPLLTFAIGIFLSSCANAQSTKKDTSTFNPNISSSAAICSIPIEISGKLIFLQVRINNSEPLWFNLDSGAEGLLLDTRRAKALGLRLG
jgi:hypothetical protein